MNPGDDAAATTAPSSLPPAAEVRRVIERTRAAVVAALVTVGLSAPGALALARRDRWWEWIAPEDTPMTWLQSCVLVVAGAGAAGMALLSRLPEPTGRAQRAWSLLAGGFALLALDERFALHERVRDRFLAPRDIRLPLLPWVAPGDFLVMLLAVAGLVLLPSLWRALDGDGGARRALAVGVGLAAVAVGGDSVDPAHWSVDAERLQQTLEEVIELASGLCLLAAVILALLGAVGRLAEQRGPVGRTAGPVGRTAPPAKSRLT